ncbi:MAG: TonB-dependent receptor [Pseudomonas sp.]
MLPNRPAFAAHYALVGSLGLLASSVALANDEAIRLSDTVVTASGFEQKITEAPASISVISQEDLQQNRYNNLAQALDGVEGIDIRQSTGKTGGLNISIRGMPSEYTLILIDGRRQNAAGDVTPNGFGDTSTSFMPPLSAIERIEVIRGPMSTLYGSDAIGGVVNIITKKVAKEWHGSVTLDHTFQENSDYGDTSNTSIYASGPLIDDTLGLAVRASLFDREASDLTFDDGSEVPKRGVAPVDGRNYTIGGKLTYTPHTDHDLWLDAETGRQTYKNGESQVGSLDDQSGFRPAPDSNSAVTVPGYLDELEFERTQFALGHTGRFASGTLVSSITHSKTETDGRSIPGARIQIGEQPNGRPLYDYYVYGDQHPTLPHAPIIGSDRELETTNLILDSKYTMALGSHILTVGGQYWDAELNDGIAAEKFEQSSWASFVEDEWRLRDDLALTLGTRYEDHDSFGSHISPRAYLVWNTTDQWTLKGGVSRGYKVPSLNDLHDGINGVTSQGDRLTIGSPDLDPEISTNTELGAYYDNFNGFNANATIFHNKFKDKISSGEDVVISGNSLIPNGTYSQQVNIDEAVTQGVELASSWQFAPAWKISGSYTFTESEQKSGEDKGAALTNTPKHLLFARLDWQATDRLGLWFKGEHRSERARFTQRRASLSGADQALLNDIGDLKSYEVFHLGGSLRAADNVTLNATIYNVFDKDFTKGSYYINDNDDLAWASNYAHISRGMASSGTIEEGRRLWLSATIDF